MIKINKLNEPTVLVKNAYKWKTRLLKIITEDKTPTQYLLSRYSDPEIKKRLIEETHGKCAYCESKLLHIHHGDVEHIFPKSLDESKRYEWENLTLACEVCNQKKSNVDPNLNNILNPYTDSPEASLIFFGVLAKGADNKGESTRILLDLNRTALVERRQERLDKIILIIKELNNSGLPIKARQAIYQDLIQNEASNKQEYASMVRLAIKCFEGGIASEIKAA
ncbi:MULTISPECIES: HNH endonuclease [Acinetobacter]|uniref:HNH endonuclease n=1 Tax=Acinetobacter TaxID=469 RepID=UPI0002CF411C|nr:MULTISPECIES: HNH endonuclease [Acinetobacter]ENV02676.1 TIGR02646 family protein [Acinetobacter sp. NIPH 817]MCU4635294.1 HNH endonuclease [Acinetobacter sp. WU_MDCI_Abxa265]RFF25120.1 HNH endonuclease [Acinetobacter sp. JW]